MKHIITAQEARKMATNNEEKFINSWTAKRILRKVKKKATQGYLETGWIEVLKTECQLAYLAFRKLGYIVRTDHCDFENRHYINLDWSKA